MALVQSALVMIFPALVIVAGLKDLTSYTIPNWISLALLAAFFPAALAVGMPLETIGLCAAVGAGALMAGIVMFALGWIGGGDAKLFAAAALWIGWPAFLPFVLITAVMGGTLAVGLLTLRSAQVAPFVPARPRWLLRLASRGESVPYGVAIAAGALAQFAASPIGVAVGRLF
ncbi:MAG TPA: prepilin peptidase [Phenylobacterium sp.]